MIFFSPKKASKKTKRKSKNKSSPVAIIKKKQNSNYASIKANNLDRLLLAEKLGHMYEEKIDRDDSKIWIILLHSKTSLARHFLMISGLALIFWTKPIWCQDSPEISVKLLIK